MVICTENLTVTKNKFELIIPYSVWAILRTLRYGGGGGIMAPLVTLVFLKVGGQNLVVWGIMINFLQK